MSNSQIVVIHHSADFDGLFCREIARKRFGDTAEYVGWDYGDPVPDVPSDATLYMLDISIDALMTHQGLVWIDHHKTAIEKFSCDIPGLRIDGVAACRLAWQYWFNPGGWDLLTKDQFINRSIREPLAVRLAGEYDVWDKRDPRADLFQYGLKSCDLSKLWSGLFSKDSSSFYDKDTGDWKESACVDVVDTLLESAKAIEYYHATLNASIIAKSGFTVEFEGLTFLALNTPRCNSLSFEAGIRDEHDGLLGFWWNGSRWTVSLYGVPHKPDIDLSAIAVRHGGGGHRQACGFIVDALPFVGQDVAI